MLPNLPAELEKELSQFQKITILQLEYIPETVQDHTIELSALKPE